MLMNSKRLRLGDRMTRMKPRNEGTILVGKSHGKRPLEDREESRKITLSWILWT